MRHYRLTIPVDVLVTTASGATRQTVWNDQSEQTFLIAVGGKASEVKNVTIDPEDWILKYTIDPSAHTVLELRQYTQAAVDEQQRSLAQSMEWREVAGKLTGGSTTGMYDGAQTHERAQANYTFLQRYSWYTDEDPAGALR